jgi:YegS/Rv2252/BmrU family lipid kinase
MTWWTVVNPSAGGRKASAEHVRSVLDRQGVPYVLATSESARHLADLVGAAIGSGHTRFCAVGGDGTLSLLVDALLRHEWDEPPTVGILPAGSGSDFIRTFGMSQHLEEAVTHLTSGSTYPVDVLSVEGEWGIRRAVNAVDAGVLGATVKRADGLTRRLGRMRYHAAFWLTLPIFSPAQVRLTMESRTGTRTWEGKALTVVVANGQFFGGGVNVAPRATLLDGRFDVQVFACGRAGALRIHPKAVKGMHLDDPAVHRFQATDVMIDVDRAWPIEIDGDFLGTTPARVRIEPGAIRFAL